MPHRRCFSRKLWGPHRPRPTQPKTRPIDLRQQTNQIEDLISIPTNFLERSTFDFFNRIGPKQTFERRIPISALEPGASIPAIMMKPIDLVFSRYRRFLVV